MWQASYSKYWQTQTCDKPTTQNAVRLKHVTSLLHQILTDSNMWQSSYTKYWPIQTCDKPPIPNTDRLNRVTILLHQILTDSNMWRSSYTKYWQTQTRGKPHIPNTYSFWCYRPWSLWLLIQPSWSKINLRLKFLACFYKIWCTTFT